MKLKITDEQKALLEIIDGPVWHDECEHGLEAYIASFKVFRQAAVFEESTVKEYDLYVFEDDGQNVCIRYGDEAEEYISPGSVLDFTKTACLHGRDLPEYWQAFEILQKLGCFTWNISP